MKPPIVVFQINTLNSASAHRLPSGRTVVHIHPKVLLRLAPWVMRAAAAHEVGHLRAKHIQRTEWLSLGASVALCIVLWSLPVPWWVKAPLLLVSIFACDRWGYDLLTAPLYRGFEVEADVLAMRAGAPIRRFRSWAARTDLTAAARRLHRDILLAVERRSR